MYLSPKLCDLLLLQKDPQIQGSSSHIIISFPETTKLVKLSLRKQQYVLHAHLPSGSLQIGSGLDPPWELQALKAAALRIQEASPAAPHLGT